MLKFIMRAVLFSVLPISLLAQQNPTASEIEAKIATKKMDHSMAYGLVLVNKSSQPIRFDAIPDIAFQHWACTPGTIFATTVSHWSETNQRWEKHDTFVSGVETSGRKDYKTTAYELQPGRSLCAGWWLPDDAIRKLKGELKLTACTTFQEGSRCFESLPFRLETTPTRQSHRDTAQK
jgi:hypothetical protein